MATSRVERRTSSTGNISGYLEDFLDFSVRVDGGPSMSSGKILVEKPRWKNLGGKISVENSRRKNLGGKISGGRGEITVEKSRQPNLDG